MQEYHMSHVTSSIINFVTALFSKFCSILVVNPLIVIKTKVEMIGDPYSGTYDCIKKTYNKGGIKGFYKVCFH